MRQVSFRCVLEKQPSFVDLLTDKNKTYEAVLLLGKTTDTQDITGEVLEEKSTEALTEEKVREAIEGFIGDYEQIPPMYSALKVNGKKLYELAREGKVVERKARPVKILDIRIIEMDLPRVRMEVSCSKGTYIRTLCHDIGETAWMWRMYGITDPYKSIGVSDKGCKDTGRKSEH